MHLFFIPKNFLFYEKLIERLTGDVIVFFVILGITQYSTFFLLTSTKRIVTHVSLVLC